MRMAELSRSTGVPVPTIKYYLRDGLLPPGERTSRNQAEYGERHVRRLRVIRCLVEVARLPLATIRQLLQEIDSPDPRLHHTFGMAQQSITTELTTGDERHRAEATRMLDDVLARRGWRVGPDNPAHALAVSVLATYLALGDADLTATLDRYAEALELVAAADLATIDARADPGEQVEGVVIGTLLGDTLLAALRRLAHEDASAHTFGPQQP